LIECAVKNGVRHFIFSSTCAVYGNPAEIPVTEDSPTQPVSSYGWSKLMSEIMLRDSGRTHDLRYAILRYFNVAGADPRGRSGQSTRNATHLIKVAVETALGLRRKLEVFGTDYATPDGTCIRDYIHVADLTRAHSDVLRHLRSGGPSLTLNLGYRHGFSVLEVIEAVKRASDVDFKVEIAGRRPGDPARIVADCRKARATLGWQHGSTIFRPSSVTHWRGNESLARAAPKARSVLRIPGSDHRWALASGPNVQASRGRPRRTPNPLNGPD
jgi:UDP-glucose 4-epimerase